MHKIDTPNAVNGEYKDRDEYLRTPGTIIDASIFQAIQDEIVNVIETAGIVLRMIILSYRKQWPNLFKT